MKNNSMTVITSKPFGAMNVDVYQNDKHQYYMTREQIGAALEYNNPNKAIQNIHVKNTDRLDPLSTFLKLRKVEGGITKEREYIVVSSVEGRYVHGFLLGHYGIFDAW